MRKLAIAVVIVFAAVALGAYCNRVRTPPVVDRNGDAVEGSVASLEEVRLGGWDQYILVRGHSPSNPILLFLHGGPGMPMMYLAHVFGRELERDFLVVHWDQRGAGKSYDPPPPIETMNVEQFLSDAHELVLLLRQRYGGEKIYLAGHSWGSYLGMIFASRYPDLLHAYIGIGQVVDEERAAVLADAWLTEQARQRGDEDALRELQELGAAVREKYLFKFGGELYLHTSWMPFLITGLFSPEYSLRDAMNVGKGSSFSSRHMELNALSGPLIDEIAQIEVPVYFFTGRHDYVTPFELIEVYNERLQAPAKRIVWFDESAHFPFFEEPGRFADEMKRVLAGH
jgi:pimeloyl-ACP methyl ester carboxylesterase